MKNEEWQAMNDTERAAYVRAGNPVRDDLLIDGLSNGSDDLREACRQRVVEHLRPMFGAFIGLDIAALLPSVNLCAFAPATALAAFAEAFESTRKMVAGLSAMNDVLSKAALSSVIEERDAGLRAVVEAAAMCGEVAGSAVIHGRVIEAPDLEM
ncbi:MAG TPA: hypothetical protein VF791_04185 [Pyrinomonadaceae bacterium]